MSLTVTLFKGISPNYGKHYKFFTSYADYIDSLGNYYKRYTLTDDRISDNQIIFSAAENVDAAEVSYCYINRNDGNSNQAYYFYHVTSGSVRGGMAFLQLELDVWATYLQRVNFGEIYVERCNRAIFAHGQYDMPDFTISAPSYTTIGDFTATNSTLAIVFLCGFKSKISIFNNSLTYVALFGCALNEITTPGSVTQERSFENICATIGGVSSVLQTIDTIQYSTDAAVLSAYIVPKSMIDNAYGNNWTSAPTLTSVSDYGELNFKPHILCRPGIITKNITIPADSLRLQSVGTRLESMILPRDTDTLTVQYQFVTKNDGISVFVCCGNNVLDITKSFQLTLTTANDGYNTGEKIANALELVRVGASASGGGLSFATNAAGYIASKFTNISPRITSGDAASTFYNKSNTNYKSPYVLTKYTSNTNVGYINRDKGAIFNSMYTQPLVTIFNSALLGVGPPNSTYIQGDIDCYGAQKDVIDFFVQRFREGVYLEKI